MALTIGVDVGGTKVAAGSSTTGDDPGEGPPTDSSTNPKETAETIAEVVDLLKGKYDEVSAVGLGTAGFVDEARATVLFAPNLAWRDEPIKEKVESLVGLPVVVENDGNATAWGEARFGAGRGRTSSSWWRSAPASAAASSWAASCTGARSASAPRWATSGSSRTGAAAAAATAAAGSSTPAATPSCTRPATWPGWRPRWRDGCWSSAAAARRASAAPRCRRRPARATRPRWSASAPSRTGRARPRRPQRDHGPGRVHHRRRPVRRR